MESQIKAVYITKKGIVEYSDKNAIYFQYHEFIDLYLSKDVTFRKYIDSVVKSFEEKIPNCEIIFIEPSDDYIIKKFNEYLIDRLKSTYIKFQWLDSVRDVDFKPIKDIKFQWRDPVRDVDFKQIKDGKFINE